MASSPIKPSLTEEQLSDIADYEKFGPQDLQEKYDMLLDAGMSVPEQSSSQSLAGPGLHRHKRKSSRPVQYCPMEGLSMAKQTMATTDLNHDSSEFTSILPHDPSTPTSGETSSVGQEKSLGSEGVVPFDPSQQGPVKLPGIADIHKTISKQLEQATAIADSNHQPCPFCSYVFSNVAFLIRHLKYRHGINLEMQLGMPQDAVTEASNPTAQQPPLHNQEQDPLSTSYPAGADSKEPKPNDTEEHLKSAGEKGDNVMTKPQIRHSHQASEVNKLGVGDQRLDLPNEMVLQKMDQLVGSTLSQVGRDNQPREPIIICDKCTRAFTNLEDLEQHQRVHNVAKTFECEYCHKLFQNPSSLKKHTKLHTDGKIYACDHCDKSFAAAAYLKTHMRLHTKQKPFVCKHCGKAFAASGTLISHERIHINDKPYGCEFCGKRFRQGSHLNRHKIIHTNVKPHVCGKCNRAFADVANLRRHERIHSQNNPNVCTECGKSFINLSSLKKHERLHTNEKPYICRHCSKPFASSGNLISHERTHTNERPYICKECGKAFTQSSHLKAHMGTHSTDTLYVCKHCGRGFTQRSTLCVHERIHLNKKPYVCKVCDRAFTQSSTLKAHIRTHTKEKAHICKVCGKAFSARGNLRSHELIHTDEKPFKCRLCPKAFKQGSTLRAHERTHTKERPYVCRACGKAFADGSNLKAHTLRIHCKDGVSSLGLLQGGDPLTSAMLTQVVNEIPNPDEVYSANQFNDLRTGLTTSQSPVGIKIKKTLEGLTSVLRFNKEESPSLSSTSDPVSSHQGSPDDEAQDTEVSGLESQTEPITNSSDPSPFTGKETSWEMSSSREASNPSETLFGSSIDDHQSSPNFGDSVLDLSRRPGKLSETGLSEDENEILRVDNDQSSLSRSGVYPNEMKPTDYDIQNIHGNCCQSASSCLYTEDVDGLKMQEPSDGELTFDDDNDDDLASLSSTGNKNVSLEGPESLSEQDDTSSGSSKCHRGEGLDLQKNPDLRTSHPTESQVMQSVATGNSGSRTPAISSVCIREGSLLLEDCRPKGETAPISDRYLDFQNRNREMPSVQSQRHTTEGNSRPNRDLTPYNEKFFDCGNSVAVQGRWDAGVGGSRQYETSKSKEQPNCRQSLLEDLELSRILPLN